MCNCQNYSIESPLLTIRANSNGGYSLVNISRGGEHQDSCSLKYDRILPSKAMNEVEHLNFTHLDNSDSLQSLMKHMLLNAKLNQLKASSYSDNKQALLSDGVRGISIDGTPLKEMFNFGFGTLTAVKDPIKKETVLFEVFDNVKFTGNCYILSNKLGRKDFKLYPSITEVVFDNKNVRSEAYIVIS